MNIVIKNAQLAGVTAAEIEGVLSQAHVGFQGCSVELGEPDAVGETRFLIEADGNVVDRQPVIEIIAAPDVVPAPVEEPVVEEAPVAEEPAVEPAAEVPVAVEPVVEG